MSCCFDCSLFWSQSLTEKNMEKKKKKKEDCFDIVISKVWQALEKNKIGNGFVFWIMNEITGSGVCLILLRTKKTD